MKTRHKPTIAIADDHELLRQGLERVLLTSGIWEVVASVGDAQEAFDACVKHTPRVLVMDVDMPGRDPLPTICDIARASPQTRVIVLTAHIRNRLIELALQMGGYLIKSDPPSAILQALHRSLEGECVFSEQVRQRVASLPQRRLSPGMQVKVGVQLTRRELEVLRYIARGMDTDQMAQVMHLSPRTVERHIARLMGSTKIHDRVGLVRFALDHDLIP